MVHSTGAIEENTAYSLHTRTRTLARTHARAHTLGNTSGNTRIKKRYRTHTGIIYQYLRGSVVRLNRPSLLQNNFGARALAVGGGDRHFQQSSAGYANRIASRVGPSSRVVVTINISSFFFTKTKTLQHTSTDFAIITKTLVV